MVQNVFEFDFFFESLIKIKHTVHFNFKGQGLEHQYYYCITNHFM